MKKLFKFTLKSFIFFIVMGSIISCKNFMNSQKFVEDLETAIAYSNSPYADITINSIASETEYISPAAGNYTKDYRKTDKLKLSFIPNEKYVFVKWNATPEESISFENAANTETTATILSVEKPVIITPVVTPKDFLRITFKADQGSITPAEDHDYYLNDEFTIRYTENTDYAFTDWKAYDAFGNDVSDYLQIENNSALETTCKVLKTDTKITLEATNAKRPKVLTMAPGYNNTGVNKDSNIKLIFTQPMASSSIYWTANELANLGAASEDYSAYKVNETDYFYAYKKNEEVIFKNITIKNRATGASLLQHFGCPYFTNEENTIVLYPCLGEGVASGIDVEVTVLSSFANKESITLSGEYSGCYSTSESTDKDAPIVIINNVSIGSLNLTCRKESEFISIMDSLATFSDTEDKYWYKTSPWNNVTLTKPDVGKLNIKIEGIIKDASSYPERTEVLVEPVIYLLSETDAKQYISVKQIETQPNYQDGQTYSFTNQEDGSPLEIELPWNLAAPSGGYRVTLRVYDNKNNMTEVYYPFIYDAGDTFNTLENDYFETPNYVIRGVPAYDTFEEFYIKCNKPNLAFAGSIALGDNIDPRKTHYYPSSENIIIYDELGKNWVPVTGVDRGQEVTLNFYAKDIFGNTLLSNTSEFVSKSIINGDYPELTKLEYTRHMGDDPIYLYLTIKDNCSSQISTISFCTTEYKYLPSLVGSASYKDTNRYLPIDGQLQTLYNRTFYLPDGSKDGEYKANFSQSGTLSTLDITITDGNGFSKTFSLKQSLNLGQFASNINYE